MGGKVSVTNRCGDDLQGSVWVELSEMYPYHFDEIFAGCEHKFTCGVGRHSLKVTKTTDRSREDAEKRRKNGSWAIGTSGIMIAMSLLDEGTLWELAENIWESGWSSVDAIALQRIFEIPLAKGELAVQDVGRLLSWIHKLKGMALVETSSKDKAKPLSIILGDICRRVYTNGRKYHVEAHKFVARGKESPPIERVPEKEWESMCRIPQFGEITLLTLVRDDEHY